MCVMVTTGVFKYFDNGSTTSPSNMKSDFLSIHSCLYTFLPAHLRVRLSHSSVRLSDRSFVRLSDRSFVCPSV